MLRIITGKAGTGKTAAVMAEISSGVKRGEGEYILLVPEQYSHEAEREMCAVCGDRLSLYAEVLSFTGLARKIATEVGGGAVQYLDKGGRLLCMALTAESLYSRLRVYQAARRKPELQAMLLTAVDELKTACITPEELLSASESTEGALADKLFDLSLILSAFDAIAANGHADPSDRLNVLAEQIKQSSVGENTHIYIDGFTDFTAQERRVTEELMLKGADLTVCLGCDDLNGDSEIFALPRMTAHALLSFAAKNGIETSVTVHEGSANKADCLVYVTDRMFSYTQERFEGETGAVRLYAAADPETECELAAAKAAELIRTTGCRLRDIAVAVRGFDDYRLSLEYAFKRYDIPFYAARKSDLLSRPLPALIAAAYEIISGGWESEDMLDYMRTGLAGLEDDECDELENYIFMWQLRGSAWTLNKDWTLHPDGYGAQHDDDSKERLKAVNLLRKRISEPLLHFDENTRKANTALEQVKALSRLLSELELAQRLEARSQELKMSGRAAAAQEYAQLWDITVSALEQCAAMLGDTETDTDSFGRLFTTMLSRYDVGTIPATLDSVTAGDLDRMRRRNIKHLLVLGASDARLPMAADEQGVFSADERKKLLEMDIDLGGMGDSELWREFSLIYNCLTLPSETLSLCYPAFDAAGEPQRPAFVLRRARLLTGAEIKNVSSSELRMNGMTPALYLAANAVKGGGDEICVSAAALLSELEPERMEILRKASESSRGRLSERSVRALYGKNLRLSASRIDKFASCRFAYFMQYGLKARTRKPAGFTAPELGIFMHYVLEHVARDVTESGGFGSVSEDELMRMTDKYISEYVHLTLNDFREKTKRFEYLFRRLTKDVRNVVRDMANELKSSDFEPLSFELDFGNSDIIPPIELGEGGDSLILTGIADRVDGWLHDGRLYLRIVDYKTGKKSFSLDDVRNGMGLQMLLYLFSLGENGKLLYGRETVPAGVLYVPARDAFLTGTSDMSDEKLAEEKRKKLTRSGLILDDPEVINAMEHGTEPSYIPVKFKEGKPYGDALASAERFGLLAKHIDETLKDMASELRQGSIAADPFYRSQQDYACLNCDYLEACHFADGENGERLRVMPKLQATKVWSILEGGAVDE